jgi:hypothetical protein
MRENLSILNDLFWRIVVTGLWDRWDRLWGKGRYGL